MQNSCCGTVTGNEPAPGVQKPVKEVTGTDCDSVQHLANVHWCLIRYVGLPYDRHFENGAQRTGDTRAYWCSDPSRGCSSSQGHSPRVPPQRVQ